MDVKTFAEIFEEQFAQSDSMLNSKRKEYAGEKVDVLHNFRKAAHLEGTTLREALAGVMVKHTVSLYDMMHEDHLRPMEVWDEKITDHLNYLILLKAIVIEEMGLESGESVVEHTTQSIDHIEAGLSSSGFPTLTPVTNTDKDN